ncbi:MAG: TetR family transcriptional regulator [Proteobacteria bacterium]|nr:TetR family transcriptional regulator [Pseudomonadota bacterium]
MTSSKKKIQKKNKDALNTKKDILQSAIEVFSEKGFMRSTLEQIAVKAKVTRGAVYWHFKNKHEIFEALHEELHQPLTASILEDMQKNCDDSISQLEKLCVKLLVDLDNDSTRKKILTIFLCKCDYSYDMEEILEKQRQRKLKNIDLFAEYFERAKKNKYVAQNFNPKITAISLACYMSGIVTEYLRNPQLFDLRKKAPQLIKQFFASFKS